MSAPLSDFSCAAINALYLFIDLAKKHNCAIKNAHGTDTEKQNLKHLSIEARHQTKLQFFHLYEKYGNVAKCARDLGIAPSTATVWVREYKANGKKVVKEKRHGRKKAMGEL